ncbi:MAG: pilus assembly protein N-terminal domain-containing protein [Acidobacteriaceae bacterium]|nr:pilus assembly protein N-terminal domain-containing protein [Acidobacteriaceae bacterium]
MKVLLLLAVCAPLIAAQATAGPPQAPAPQSSTAAPGIVTGGQKLPRNPATPGAADLTVSVSKSIVLDHPAGIRRVSITNPEIAEAVAVSSVELMINGKAAGDTTLILWDPAGTRRTYDIHVVANDTKTDVVRGELLKEVGPGVSLTIEDANVFLRGTVADAIAADRAASIAGTLGKVVNLLRVTVPAEEPQILLRVRFADVDRSATSQLGMNIFSVNQKGIANFSTTQFGQYPQFNVSNGSSQVTFTDLLNIFYLRPDLNLGAFIKALEAKALLQMLAEPNLLTLSGKPASFLAGGEFPFPTIQGGASGVGQITVQFKEFGIKLNFVPTVTPRGTIHLEVTPEVSSLDYSNGLTVNGFTVPGLATRRVQTEVELQDGQSFVIAGLLNNQVTEQLDKVPGLANIPVLGKLFQSRSLSKTNSELLVLVTPELVRPLPAGAKPPEVSTILPFMKDAPQTPPRTPGAAVTGPAQPLPKYDAIPLEQLKNPAQTSTPPNPAANGPAPLMVVQPVQTQPASQPPTTSNPGETNH